MRIPRKYYYLIAGLPDLNLDERKPNFDLKALVDHVIESVDPRDVEYVQEIFICYDHQNLLHLLRGREELQIDKGYYSLAFLKEHLNTPEDMPDYLIDIIKKYRLGYELGDASDTDFSMGHYVWSRFYEEIESKSTNRFSRKWYQFDQILRNIQSAWMCRRLDLPLKEQLVGYGDIIEQFVRNHTPDFGLRRELSLGNEIFTLLDSDCSILEREYQFDKIRFRMADELTTFNYFDIDNVLAFLAQADIIDRWIHLDPTKGRQKFQSIVHELTDYNKNADAPYEYNRKS